MEAANTTTSSTPDFQLLQLPDACLLRVLQRLADTGDRNHRSLFSTARAYSRLHAAAPAALRALKGEVRDLEHTDAVLLFLAHSKHVTSISLESPENQDWSVGPNAAAIEELPSQCSQLRSLRAADMWVQLGADSAGRYPGVLQACGSQLTRLELANCILLDDDAAAAASALLALSGTALQHLQLHTSARWEAHDRLPAEVLGRLSRLTHLTLHTEGLLTDAAALEGISGLTQLEALNLQRAHQQHPRTTVPVSMMTGLQRLTRLELHNGSVEPAALSSRLQHLELSTHIEPDNAGGTAALLAQLGRMQQLTALKLTRTLGDPAPAQSYTALTPSTLQRLQLVFCPLAAGAWQQMFPAGRQRTALTQLRYEAEPLSVNDRLGTEDIAALVNAAPGLRRLSVSSLAAGAQLQPLERLLHLSSLDLSLRQATVVAGELALPSLRHLEVAPCMGTQADLLPLTRLTQLTHLHTALQAGGPFFYLGVDIFNKAPEGARPDVWRQLLERVRDFTDDTAVREAATQALAEAAAADA